MPQLLLVDGLAVQNLAGLVPLFVKDLKLFGLPTHSLYSTPPGAGGQRLRSCNSYNSPQLGPVVISTLSLTGNLWTDSIVSWRIAATLSAFCLGVSTKMLSWI